MKEEMNAGRCGRENDLIAYLYGELNDLEMRSFQKHMHDCAECNTELASFTNIRESVVTWRNESLAGVSSAATASSVPATETRRPSAVAALREFFNLSPLWLKGAVAFASLLFCLFAVLAVANLRDLPPAPVVRIPDNTPSKQLNAPQHVDNKFQPVANSETSPKVEDDAKNSPNRVLKNGSAPGRLQLATNVPTQSARRPLSKIERQQLAADLRLVAGNNDNDLDLLDDRMNNSN